MNYDLILKDCKIINGSGNPWFYGEIGIKDGKIIRINSEIKDNASKVINVNKNIVCPGFIDIHSHTDYILPLLGKVESTI
ncbi:MAG: D-aminoacylase, partial [Candidatus Lokiarchaeota archaeon]|nr:D-aminoacylase [Candidatus Lokiarchaeota archaeon]